MNQNLCPSCREPLSMISGDGCANMTKHSEVSKMEDTEVGYIIIHDIVDNSDGSSTVVCDMDNKALQELAKIGLDFSVYCLYVDKDIDEVLEELYAKAGVIYD